MGTLPGATCMVKFSATGTGADSGASDGSGSGPGTAEPHTDTDTPSVQLPPAGKLCHTAQRSAGKQFRTRQRSGLQRVDEATAETQHM